MSSEDSPYVPKLRHPDPAVFGIGTLYSGTGTPSSGLGLNGDIYIDLSTGDLYQRTGDSWTIFTGSGGVSNISGSGSPVGARTPDAVNQFYRDTAGNTLWQANGLSNTNWLQWI